MKHKQQLEDLLQAYREVFQYPKGLLPKREVNHEIQLLSDSPFQNIMQYKKYTIEVSGVKK